MGPVIHIYDANAYLRQALNRQQFQLAASFSPRMVYNAANAAPMPQVWVWDGPNNNERRRALHPGYKIRDYQGQENIFAGLRLYKEVLTHSTAIQITVPNYEADDVCGTLARRYAKQNLEVTVHTNDFDFYQLTTDRRIRIQGVKPVEGVPAEFVPLFKALRGDKSDKIDGIPGFGPAAWASFKELWPLLDQILQEKDVKALREMPFSKKALTWLLSDENVELLFVYYQITHMLDVPVDLIDQHTVVGQCDPHAAEQLFSRFML